MMVGSHHRPPLALASALALVWTLPLSAHPGHLAPHVHGIANLKVVIEAGTVSLQLTIPGSDIVGFERQAHTPEEQSLVDKAVATLSLPLDLFAFRPDQNCTVMSTHAHFGAHNEPDSHERNHDHAEFMADHLLDCPSLAGGKLELGTHLFGKFDQAQTLEVQALVDGVAVLGTLSPEKPTMTLR